jgi:hypothetical protein
VLNVEGVFFKGDVMIRVVPDHIIQQADSGFQNPKTFPLCCPKCEGKITFGSYTPEHLKRAKRETNVRAIRTMPKSPVGGGTRNSEFDRSVTYCVPCKILLWVVRARAEDR